MPFKGRVYSQMNLTGELDHKLKQSEKLPNVFRVVAKPWTVFNAEKKLFDPAQIALTKLPTNEAKTYKKWFS